MASTASGKAGRLFSIYARLASGETLKKSDLAQQFQISSRSVQRDIDALRNLFAEDLAGRDIVYDARAGGYRLTGGDARCLSNSEILAVCKILLESRSMLRDEMMPILDKLVDCCVPAESRRDVQSLLANEKYHYIEPHHGKYILNGLWEIGQAIQRRQVLELCYWKMGSDTAVERTVEPVGLLFSEYYFYLVAFLRGVDRQTHFENPEDLFPTIYRLDRIEQFHVTKEHFSPPYTGRFEEGEFRKRVQFMYGGRLQTIRFKYVGPSLEAVLDRLPTARVLERDDEGWLVQAEVFGKGIEMWLRSQGKYIQALS